MNLPGAYRKLVAFPWDLSWKCVKDEHACSVDTSAGHSTTRTGSSPTDNDVKRPRLATRDYCEDETEHIDTTELDEVHPSSENCCINLEISFSLAPSCYATSCIRELMTN